MDGVLHGDHDRGSDGGQDVIPVVLEGINDKDA